MILSSRTSILASVIIVVIVFAGVGSYVFLTNQYVPPDIAVVVLDPGFGDLSMVDQVDLGLQELSGDLVVNYVYFTAANQSEAAVIMDQLATSGSYDLIIVIGEELAEEVQSVAAAHASQKFGFIGGAVSATNVISASFTQEEAAFLAGAFAAYISVGNVSRSGVVGIIGSDEDSLTVKGLIAGFKQGLVYANTTDNLSVTLLPEVYVGSFNDSETAYNLAVNMFNPYYADGNATVIFAPVRASIMGIREAMVYANESWFGDSTSRKPFVIAAEGDQDFLGLPDINTRAGVSWVLTSVVPRSDIAVYHIINATMWDDFPRLQSESPIVYDLANGGVNMTIQFRNTDWVSDELLHTLIDLRAMILNGTIVVSDTYP